MQRPQQLPGPEDNEKFLSFLNHMQTECKKAHLTVCARLPEKMIGAFKGSGPPTNSQADEHMRAWYVCFMAELHDRLFLVVLPQRLGYWSSASDNLAGSAVNELVKRLDAFPDAIFDAYEAGNCPWMCLSE
jgi:hypothetical protein